jgi:hypothetical protein
MLSGCLQSSGRFAPGSRWAGLSVGPSLAEDKYRASAGIQTPVVQSVAIHYKIWQKHDFSILYGCEKSSFIMRDGHKIQVFDSEEFLDRMWIKPVSPTWQSAWYFMSVT